MNKAIEHPEFMTTAHAGRYLGMSVSTAGLVIRALISWHGLPVRELCGIRVRRSDLDRVLDDLHAAGMSISVDKSGPEHIVRIGDHAERPPGLKQIFPIDSPARPKPKRMSTAVAGGELPHRQWVG